MIYTFILGRNVLQLQICRLTHARCGIIGISGRTGSAAVDLYEGLLMLQHRGQDSAGMVTTDWNKFVEHKSNGLVRDAFANEAVMSQLIGEDLGLQS
jgi:amidophosphoribosyltransferase